MHCWILFGLIASKYDRVISKMLSLFYTRIKSGRIKNDSSYGSYRKQLVTSKYL